MTTPPPVAERIFRTRKLWERLKNSRFFWISVALHVLFFAVAGFLVVQSITAKSKLTFKAGPPAPNPSHAAEHKVQMTKKQNTMTAPPPTRKIVTAGLSKVALPEMPEMPMPSVAMPSSVSGMSATSLGLGSGPVTLGNIRSGSPRTMSSLFGSRESGGSSLTGYLYDLKQSADRKPTDMEGPENEGVELDSALNKKYDQVVTKLANSWSMDLLAPYYKSREPLQASQFVVPTISADAAPKAFGVDKFIKPRRWLAVYRGSIIAPETGTFRFAGVADDVLLVRMRDKLVLDACQRATTANTDGLNVRIPIRAAGYDMNAGAWFKMTAGERIPIDVVLGERPGGQFYAYLLIQKEGGKEVSDPSSGLKLPVFQTMPTNLPETFRLPVGEKPFVCGG